MGASWLPFFYHNADVEKEISQSQLNAPPV
ncbi:hypothetical protein CO2235_230136 [Cupriavidus oxalaticus]|uniref:Uncharacterized protein n=1 Tax=Cupriavidus oxalaticus TaxID=96344 RepID=A0A375G2P2_9BURK|nr:hypothetical protein CO2235_230136 [Cupriavidus oxalaticus]